jgi:hypothetical protein
MKSYSKYSIFLGIDAFRRKDVETWQLLVHVCRRWRSVIFGSPRRLNLQLVCGDKAPVRDSLAVWPPLPLVIRCGAYQTKDVVNILAGLERCDRVCRIKFWGHDISLLEKVLAAMQEPFPELTDLVINVMELSDETVSALPNSFLGGSAPCLQKLHFHGIPFPGLPKLLFSVSHLVDLKLCEIPHSGYFSPEALATAFSMLTSLELLRPPGKHGYEKLGLGIL